MCLKMSQLSSHISLVGVLHAGGRTQDFSAFSVLLTKHLCCNQTVLALDPQRGDKEAWSQEIAYITTKHGSCDASGVCGWMWQRGTLEMFSL